MAKSGKIRAVGSGPVKKLVPARGEGTKTRPIERDIWASDELAAAQLKKDSQKKRPAPKQGKPGTFNPIGDAKKFR